MVKIFYNKGQVATMFCHLRTSLLKSEKRNWAHCGKVSFCLIFLYIFKVFFPKKFMYLLAASHWKIPQRRDRTRVSLVVALSVICWSEACGTLVPLVPRPGIKSMSPALQGGFLTTGQPGQSLSYLFKRINGTSRKLVVFSGLPGWLSW